MNKHAMKKWLAVACSVASTSAFALPPNTMAQSYFTPGPLGGSNPTPAGTLSTTPDKMVYRTGNPASGYHYHYNEMYWNTGFASQAQLVRFEVTGGVYAPNDDTQTARFVLCNSSGTALTGAKVHTVFLPTHGLHQKLNFTEVLSVTSDASQFSDVFVCWYNTTGLLISSDNTDYWNTSVVDEL